MDIDVCFTDFAKWLRHNRANNDNASSLIDLQCFTVRICAMAIIVSIQDGIYSDPSAIVAKLIRGIQLPLQNDCQH